MNKVNILLADDHPIVHEGLRALIEAEPDLAVIAEADNGLEAIRLTLSLRPNVVLVDLAMPGLSGLEVTRQVKQRFPNIRVIILSMHDNEGYVLEALRNGASGYVLKESSVKEVTKAIREVAAGRRFLSVSLSQHAIDGYLERAKTGPLDPYETLTTREREVFEMTAECNTSIEIGRRLFISPRTVEIHRQNVMRKLGLRNQGELIRYAVKKVIPPQS